LPRVEELTPRITPALTAVYASGTLTVTGDAADDTGVLTADATGNILLNGDPITGGPTLGNTLAVLMDGGDGNDVLDVSALPGAGRATVLNGGNGDDSLVGGLGSDCLIGGAGNDTLRGNQGDDILIGGDGNDLLDGGSGDDRLEGDAGADTFTGGFGDDTLDGATNADTAPDTLVEAGDANVALTDVSMTGFGNDILQGIEQVSLTGGPGNNLFDASAWTAGGVTLSGGAGNDTLIGSAGNDTLDGQAGNDSLVGNAGNDILFGGDGNDTVHGGLGNDSITGGLGNDSLSGDAGTDSLIEDPTTEGATGNNLFLTNTALIGTLGTDTLSGFEQAVLSATVGTAANSFNAFNFSGPVTLNGGAGNDTLTGGASNDVLTGGTGINTLNGGPAGNDMVVESGDLNFTLANGRLGGTGPGPITDLLTNVERANISGGPGNNSINASPFTLGPVTLNGGAGNDTLTGTMFADLFAGGPGNDSIIGGAGNDKLLESLDVNAVLTNTSLTTAGVGTDTLSGIERVELDGGPSDNVFDATTFTAGPITLVGGAGNDILIGGSNNDLLIGGAGDDTFAGGAGIDTVAETADTDFTLTDNSIVGGTATGTDLLSSVERVQLTGGASDNTFTMSGASTLAVTLTGGGGNDAVVSENDADFTLGNTLLTRSTGGTFALSGISRAQLTGGPGDNTFTVSGWTGAATLTGGGGADKVRATGAGNFTLSDTLLTHSTGGTFALSGITLAQLTGDAGANRIDAQLFTGQTTLSGGDGPDTLIGGSGNDVLSGGNGADSLVGGPGNDTLDGGAGIDTLDGGAGIDVGLNGELLINIP
jgi:Ca2+-binding RTX toxin-like protein